MLRGVSVGRDNSVDDVGAEEIFDICDSCEHFNRIYICGHGCLCRRCLADENILNMIGG
jgi:hypothetical protein